MPPVYRAGPGKSTAGIPWLWLEKFAHKVGFARQKTGYFP
jgi:hypothetical protein